MSPRRATGVRRLSHRGGGLAKKLVLLGAEEVGHGACRVEGGHRGPVVVTAIHEDIPFTAQMSAEVGAEIADLAAWLRLDVRRLG